MSEELVEPVVYHALQTVPGLRRGRSRARESQRVLRLPVADAHIQAIGPHVSRQVWALVQLQLLTGARPGELVAMRPCDFDTSGRVWIYELEQHTPAHHGHTRSIYLGPRAQRVVRPFLDGRALATPLFSPREAEAERRERQHAERQTPLSTGNAPGTNRPRGPRRPPRDTYDVASYNRAIRRACEAAGIPHWHPHRIRHSAATYLRKEFGIEVARIILGHRSPAITDLYAELDREKAIEAMEVVG